MPELFIIPQSTNSVIAKVVNGEISIVGSVDVPYKSKNIFTENNLIVSLCYDMKELRIFDIQGKLIFSMGSGSFSAIAGKKNTAYLGGIGYSLGSDQNCEMFSIIDLENMIFEQKEIDLPIKVVDGKSIDDILIIENKLILVDNIIYPKYLIEYDISVPNSPEHFKTIKLPNHGTYEHIYKGDINKDWLVLFSTTVGEMGRSHIISVKGKTDGHISTYRPHKVNIYLAHNYEKYSYMDICLIDNKLFILRDDGLGFIDLNNKIDNSEFKEIKTNIIAKSLIKTSNNDLIAINENSYELIKLSEI